jgi:hypothetical protein
MLPQHRARRLREIDDNRRILPILLVPGERIELPTNGLQNRCSTAELTRLEFTAISLARLPQAALARRRAVMGDKKTPHTGVQGAKVERWVGRLQPPHRFVT